MVIILINQKISKKNFNKIINTKQQNVFPFNNNDLKNTEKIEKKYIDKNFNRNISAKNIKNNKI